MAGRVNTKFVVGLVAAAVVVLGAGLGLFYMMMNKTGETYAEQAREFEAAGNWREAEEAWGRAVGHEKTNVEWLRNWRAALGEIVPRTRTEYEDFFTEYRTITRQIATVTRDQIDVTEEYLDLLFERVRSGGVDRRAVEFFSNEVETQLAWYPEGSEGRDRLRRYRGIAWAAFSGPTSTITQEEIDAAKADLEAALAVRPGDGEVARSLVMLLDTERERAQRLGRTGQAESFRARQREVIDQLLEADPDDEWGRVTRIQLASEALQSLRGEAYESRTAELRDETRALLDWLVERVATVDRRVLDQASNLEVLLDTDAGLQRSIALYEAVAEAHDQRTDLLLSLAALRNRAGEYDAAVETLRTIEEQERLPVSVEGRNRMYIKAQAPSVLCDFTIQEVPRAESVEEKRRLLEVARAARDRYAQGLGEDGATVSMLDGQIALAEAELAIEENDNRAAQDALLRAQGHFARFNELTGYTNEDGLWREGRVATRLNKTGLARDRFEQMLELKPNDPKVMLALADVEERLGTESSLQEAYRLTQRAQELAPASVSVQERLQRLAKLTYRTESDDPIEAMVYESERLLLGVNETSPDAIAAEQLLRRGWEAHPGEARIARQLVRVLMQSDRLDEARSFVQEAREAYPDDEMIATLARRLDAGSMLEIILIGIEESQTSDLNKYLEKVEVCRRYGEPEMAKEALAEAMKIAPDDPDVIEQQFLQLLSEGRLDEAEGVVERAMSLNADRQDGITYEARLFAARGEHLEAVELLREAVSQRPTEAPLWRLLASEQTELGRINEALNSYRRALSITESDTTTIRGYVATLASQGRIGEALAEARRLKEFGERDPAFLDIYLRLEARAGGDEGLQTAINRRRQIMGERPFDTQNKLELANLYIESREWEQAEELIDEIEADSGKSLALVQTRARWYADQGKVRTENGFEDGIELARGAFVDYIVSSDDATAGVDAYLTMARFMVSRGRLDVAMRAIEEARNQQDPTRLRAEKLFGELMMSQGQVRPASEAFRRVVEAGADDNRDTYRKLLIETLLRLQEFDAASEQIAQLSGDNAKDLTVMMQSADIAMAQQDREEAMRIVDEAIGLYGSRALPYIKRAQYLMTNRGLWRDAVRNLEEALRLNPNDPQAHKLMATMHFRMDRKDEAINSWRESLRHDPSQDAVFLGLLIELVEMGRAGEALDVANEVVEQRSSDAVLMINASRVFSQREEYERANVLLEKAWRLTKDQRVGLAYIQNLLSDEPPRPGPASQVIAQMEMLGANINEDPIILEARANIERKSGKVQRALSFLSRAYEQSVENPGLVMQWLRETRRVLGTDEDAGDAIRYLKEYRAQMPDGTEQRDWLTYGLALMRIQDETEIPEAESDLMALQSDSPSEVIRRLSHRLLGSGRYNREEYEAAEQAWRAGIEAFPDDWEMHNNLAYCVGIDLGRPAEAIPLARQATQLAGSRADVYDTLGTLHLEQGDCDLAEDAFIEAQARQRTERERVTILLNKALMELKCGTADEALRYWTEADTAVYTLPTLREVVGEKLDEVKAEIDSAQTSD